MNPEKYIFLYEKFLAGNCTAEERRLLMEYSDKLKHLQVDKLPDLDDGQTGSRVLTYINSTLFDKPSEIPVKKKFNYVLLAIAASVLIVLGTLVYMHLINLPSGNTKAPAIYTGKIAPGSSKATLTLSDGRQLSLEHLEDGYQKTEQGFIITKHKNKIVYELKSTPAIAGQEIAWNSITTPKGGEFEIRLPDGSMVWLNAGSVLRFPLSFTHSAREVFLEGEAYFEVASQKSKGQKVPFRVISRQQAVEVLGTHFNVNAYANEPNIKTSLLEGSVRVAALQQKEKHVLLTPGQQSTFTNAATPINVASANMQEVTAWHKGRFMFINRDIHFIMKQLERWYDISVDYQSLPQKKFNGNIPRNVELKNVLRVFEKTSGFRFKILQVQDAQGRPERRLTMY